MQYVSSWYEKKTGGDFFRDFLQYVSSYYEKKTGGDFFRDFYF